MVPPLPFRELGVLDVTAYAIVELLFYYINSGQRSKATFEFGSRQVTVGLSDEKI
jgi:hypothetical protein